MGAPFRSVTLFAVASDHLSRRGSFRRLRQLVARSWCGAPPHSRTHGSANGQDRPPDRSGCSPLRPHRTTPAGPPIAKVRTARPSQRFQGQRRLPARARVRTGALRGSLPWCGACWTRRPACPKGFCAGAEAHRVPDRPGPPRQVGSVPGVVMAGSGMDGIRKDCATNGKRQ